VIAEKSMSYPLRAQEQPRPLDAYGLSKLQAERILQEEARRSSMEWVIIRPPLIYGAFVKGNFRRLMQLARLPLPLPLASINNKRSLLSIDNLNSFIATCLYHPNAHGQVFLVSDNQDVSTPKLLALLRQQLGKKPYLIPFPLSVIKLMAWLCGRSAEINRLTESLQVNIEQSMRLLQWQPPYTLEESLQALYHRELGRD
jgi:nucleoside-diphosphate-sugar epimerase